ncbi:HipA domain-containing protein [Psychrosphaera sp. F3M07]|uniref:HipA domain-containing protein n=1 Tax=Psychrosphaera sp. F3M07 TaxID=2841560 RepID=UPI00353046BD
MDTLYCYMNGIKVGELTRNKHHALFFTYSATWLNSPYARAISLSMPLTAKRYSGDVVVNYFDNLLPDLPEIRRVVQTQVGADSIEPFDLLTAVGSDCVGALQLLTHDGTNGVTGLGDKLSDDEICVILKELEHKPLGVDKGQEFRLSIAGAQSKTALCYKGGNWHKPIGETPTTHIFKLPMGRVTDQHIDFNDSCENEHYCMTLAREFGLDTPNSMVKKFGDTKAFIVERFDRKFNSDEGVTYRLPQEDFCQVFNVNSGLKYQSQGGIGIEKIYKMLLGSDNDKDLKDFMKAQIFNWLIAGIDAHAKNYSVFLLPGGGFKLTPFYDLLSAYPLFDNGLNYRDVSLAMGLRSTNGLKYKWRKIQTRHFFHTAKEVGYSLADMQQDIEMFYDTATQAMENATNKVLKNNKDGDYSCIDSVNAGIKKIIQSKVIVNPFEK